MIVPNRVKSNMNKNFGKKNLPTSFPTTYAKTYLENIFKKLNFKNKKPKNDDLDLCVGLPRTSHPLSFDGKTVSPSLHSASYVGAIVCLILKVLALSETS